MSRINEFLEKFAASLEPSPEWLKKADEAVQFLFEILVKSDKVRVVRHYLVGGLGKRTSTRLKADADVVVYFDDEDGRLDRASVLEEWRSILVRHKELEYVNIRVTSFLLSFEFRQISIDLVAVRDNVERGVRPNREQMRNDVDEVEESGDPLEASRELTLSAQSVDWMERRSPMAQEVARLAKFWAQTIFFDEVVYGKSYLLETLAVVGVCKAKERRASKPFLAAFQEFLTLVENIDELHLVYEHPRGKWFASDDIPLEIKNNPPVLIDPVNPYRNLLDVGDAKKKFFAVFSAAAVVTRKQINLVIEFELKKPRFSERAFLAILEMIFRPQPKFVDLNLPISNIIVGPHIIAKDLDLLHSPFPQLKILNVPRSSNTKIMKMALDSLLMTVGAVAFLQRTPNGRNDYENFPCEPVISAIKKYLVDDGRYRSVEFCQSRERETPFAFTYGRNNLVSKDVALRIPVGMRSSLFVDVVFDIANTQESAWRQREPVPTPSDDGPAPKKMRI